MCFVANGIEPSGRKRTPDECMHTRASPRSAAALSSDGISSLVSKACERWLTCI